MKKGLKVFSIVILIFIMIALILWKIYDYNVKKNTIASISAVVVKVYEKSLTVMEKNTKDLYSVSFPSEGNIGIKKGQEIKVYYDGVILQSYPGQIIKVGKIKILKDESDIQIPENVLKYVYNSRENVHVTISSLTSNGIEFTIKDDNEFPYRYTDSYRIFKKEKEERYGGYIWKDVKKISDISIKNTENILTYDLSNSTENEHSMITEANINWVPVYGELKER